MTVLHTYTLRVIAAGCAAAPALGFGLVLSLVLSLGVAAVGDGARAGQPVPRFVSLRADEVNLRAGPGTRYPVAWVYRRRYLPVEVIAEYDHWRRVRDMDGTEGWVHQSMLSGRRTFMVREAQVTLRSDPDALAPGVALLGRNVIGRLVSCAAGAPFCAVEVEGFEGWLRRSAFWGAYGDEAVD